MKIICIGKIKETFFRDIKNDSIEIIELNEQKLPKDLNEKNIQKVLLEEGNLILNKINKDDYVVSLCIEGKEIDNQDFKNTILSKKNLIFVIGSSYGLHDCIKERSNFKLSFSKMTFPHQLMRVILINAISLNTTSNN